MEISPIIIGALITSSVAALAPSSISLIQHIFSKRYKYLERNLKLLKDGTDASKSALTEIIRQQENYVLAKEMYEYKRKKSKKDYIRNRFPFEILPLLGVVILMNIHFTDEIPFFNILLFSYLIFSFIIDFIFRIERSKYTHLDSAMSYKFSLKDGPYENLEGRLSLSMYYYTNDLLWFLKRENYELDYEHLLIEDITDSAFYVYKKHSSSGNFTVESPGESGLLTEYIFVEKQYIKQGGFIKYRNPPTRKYDHARAMIEYPPGCNNKPHPKNHA